jgi:hypothetical protein
MKFEWDESKNQINIRKHGFDFSDAEELFRGFFLFDADLRYPYAEERWIGIGMTKGRVAVLAFARTGEETIRVISLRKASRRERAQYEEAIQNELEAG